MATQVGASLLQKCLIMNPLQKCKAHTSLQFYRLKSNRFGENRLTDARRAVFPKQAAPKSHAFLFCHEPLPPDTRCGEHRRGLSSREHGAESLKHRRQPRQSRSAGSIGLCGGSYCRRPSSVSGRFHTTQTAEQQQIAKLLQRKVHLLRKKPARSTEFPLRRLAVRGCERTMSGA